MPSMGERIPVGDSLGQLLGVISLGRVQVPRRARDKGFPLQSLLLIRCSLPPHPLSAGTVPLCPCGNAGALEDGRGRRAFATSSASYSQGSLNPVLRTSTAESPSRRTVRPGLLAGRTSVRCQITFVATSCEWDGIIKKCASVSAVSVIVLTARS